MAASVRITGSLNQVAEPSWRLPFAGAAAPARVNMNCVSPGPASMKVSVDPDVGVAAREYP